MIVLKNNTLHPEDEKFKYLSEHAEPEIFTHTWEILRSDDNQLCLKCSVCSHIYGVTFFKSGLRFKLFLSSQDARESSKAISCANALMNKALE